MSTRATEDYLSLVILEGLSDTSSPPCPESKPLANAISGTEAFLEIQLLTPAEPPIVPRRRLLGSPFSKETGPTSADSITVEADTDNNGTGDIILRTGDKERVRVTNPGNVAILGASPASAVTVVDPVFGSFPLDVVGPIRTLGDISLVPGGLPAYPLIPSVRATSHGFSIRLRSSGIDFLHGDQLMAYLERIQKGTLHYYSFSVNGTKSFVQADPTDPDKTLTYYALEGPEAGTYVRGTGRLVNGNAEVRLPEDFALTTSETAGLAIQVTPRGDCNGLYVASQNTSTIEVKELGAGRSNVAFDYFVQGTRKGFEELPVVREKDE
ncbi:hypothetical protein ACFL2T_04080 [Elusimicrobiota bacterium]